MGEHLLPEIRQYWYFKVSSGNKDKRYAGRVVIYYLQSKIKIAVSEEEKSKKKGTRVKKFCAIYRLNHRWVGDLEHQDVQQFTRWHEEKYGRKPESLFC